MRIRPQCKHLVVAVDCSIPNCVRYTRTYHRQDNQFLVNDPNMADVTHIPFRKYKASNPPTPLAPHLYARFTHTPGLKSPSVPTLIRRPVPHDPKAYPLFYAAVYDPHTCQYITNPNLPPCCAPPKPPSDPCDCQPSEL